MIQILNWLFRHLIRATIGTTVILCLILLALIFWEKRFVLLFEEIENLILGDE